MAAPGSDAVRGYHALRFINGKHRTNKNAVVLFDRVFVYLNTATTIAAVMRSLGRNLSGKRARSPTFATTDNTKKYG